MSNILTQEDKKLLRRVCRYLGSIGMSEAIIEIDDINGGYGLEDINWEQVTHFSNNYTAEVPSVLHPIYDKIVNFIFENDLIPESDETSIDWERLEIKIDCDSGEIVATHDFSYTIAEDSLSTEWDSEDDERIQQLFVDLEEDEDNQGELILRYNGSGDSGYIDSTFENGGSVPSSVEDWCYGQLESQHGGWEINEGSQGFFTFNMNDETIHLEHEYNIQQSSYDTIWEEKF